MARVLAFGGVRFVLAGALVAMFAVAFVGRADAASVLSSSVSSPSAVANSAASGAQVVAGDRALTLKWSAVKGAAGYRVSWRGRVLKGGKPTGVWSKKWLGLKVLKASARSYKASGLVNGRQYLIRLESNTKGKKSRWVVRSTPVGTPNASSCASGGGVCVVGDTGPGGGKVFYAPGGAFREDDAPCGPDCRYLEAAPAGWNGGDGPDPNRRWGGGTGLGGECSNKTILGADRSSVGSGFANTAAIMADCPSTDPANAQSAPAALAASTYAPTVNGVVVTGWFLPSRDELTLLDVSGVGGLVPGVTNPGVVYWSSSQYNAEYAWYQFAGQGAYGQNYNVKFVPNLVRPIRAF